MKPFVVWLDTDELNELITHVIRAEADITATDGIMNSNELIALTEKLLAQNKNLITLFKKIQPVDGMNQSAINEFGLKNKCDNFKKLFVRMKNHCSLYNLGFEQNLKTGYVPICEGCPLKNGSAEGL